MAFALPISLLVMLSMVTVLSSIVGAVPVVINNLKRDVADPPVTTPNASTVWVVGATQTVVW